MAAASAHLTETVAMQLPVESLPRYKGMLKRFFSRDDWTEADEDALAALVDPVLQEGPWDVALGGIQMWHGRAKDGYRMYVTGAGATASIFDRAFTGPVVPEPTPHPRKVKFTFGGTPSNGVWYRRGDTTDDARAARLLAEPDVTDVMVAGTFVTVGLDAGSSWENRLDAVLGLVTEMFPAESAGPPAMTREELMREGGRAVSAGVELHLLDPDDPESRQRLRTALAEGTVAERRIAVAILTESSDSATSVDAVERGRHDRSVTVRRTAIDAAADLENGALRHVFEDALDAPDPWTRWRAVRALGAIGPSPSRERLEGLSADPDFQVRFEVARVLLEP
jgi:hypothetical protein